MSCKLTEGIGGKPCQYDLAGITALYLANYYPAIEGSEVPAGVEAIAYEIDADGVVTGIHLPDGEKFFKVEGNENAGSFTDDLVVGSNGGRYRTHGINTVIGQNDIAINKQGDALSLGKFIAVAIDSGGVGRILGRTAGLTASAFNYASGAAQDDAAGWTFTAAGSAKEISPIIKDVSVITPIYTAPVVTP